MKNSFGGVVTAMMAWPIAYMLFSSSDTTARVASSTVLAMGAGAFVVVFMGSGKNDD